MKYFNVVILILIFFLVHTAALLRLTIVNDSFGSRTLENAQLFTKYPSDEVLFTSVKKNASNGSGNDNDSNDNISMQCYSFLSFKLALLTMYKYSSPVILVSVEL